MVLHAAFVTPEPMGAFVHMGSVVRHVFIVLEISKHSI